MIKSMNIAFGIAQLNYPVKAKAYQQNVFIQFFKHATPIKKYHVILYKVSLVYYYKGYYYLLAQSMLLPVAVATW